MKPSYSQSVTFQRVSGLANMYRVVNLVGLTTPEISSDHTRAQVQKFIDENPKVKVTLKE